MTLRAIPRPALVALILAAEVILLAAGWFLVVAPQRAHARSIANAAALTKAQIAEARTFVPSSGNAASLPKQPAIRTSLLYRLAKAMPSTEDQPDLLLQIDQVARAAGVTLLSIAPAQPTAGDGFTVVPISLTASGDFYGLTDMLYRLRALVAVRHGGLNASGRLFAVQSVTLTPSGTGKQLSADVSVNAYVYGTTLASVASGVTTTATTSTGSTGTTTTTTTATTTSG